MLAVSVRCGKPRLFYGLYSFYLLSLVDVEKSTKPVSTSFVPIPDEDAG
ncbi:MAG: hypothetical protein HC893_01400 [Chloroflexaceae bacterium]|nr:hypothetical protein [Chloroflexaceae bacterium]NJL32742.1 hypothetical protein [Chloroflexaceae bacterium]NJO05862.1 hypothetical protein [Chloroflexaceae bacterium]